MAEPGYSIYEDVVNAPGPVPQTPLLPQTGMEQFGSLMTKGNNPASLALLAKIIGEYGRSTSEAPGRVQQILANMLGGQSTADELNRRPGVKPTAGVVATPKPVVAPVAKAAPPAVPTSAPATQPIASTTFNPNPKLADLPALMGRSTMLETDLGPSGKTKLLPTVATGEQPAGSLVANNVPAAVATPSVQNLNVGGVEEVPIDRNNLGHISWMLGPDAALKVAQDTITNSLNRQKAGTENLDAHGRLISSQAAAQRAATEAQYEERKVAATEMSAKANETNARSAAWGRIMEALQVPGKIRLTEAQAKEQTALAIKNELETDPEYIQEKAKAEALGKGAGEIVARQAIADSPVGLAPLPEDVQKYLGMKDYRDLYRTFGEERGEKLIEAIKTASSRVSAAGVTAKGTVDAASKIATANNTLILKAYDDALDFDRKMIVDIKGKTYTQADVTPQTPAFFFSSKGMMLRTKEQQQMIDYLSNRISDISKKRLAVAENIREPGSAVSETYTQSPAAQKPATQAPLTAAEILKEAPTAKDIVINPDGSATATINGKRTKITR